MKVVYYGTYRAEYSRNRILIAGLRAAGVEVTECHETLWHGIEDRVQAASGGWLRLGLLWRAARAYLRLAWRGLRLADFDVLMCGYPGQLDVFLAWLVSRLHRKPLVWDVFMSIYLIALERGLERQGRRTVSLLRQVEQAALRLPDLLIQDTSIYVDWLTHTHRVSPAKFRLVPTGADDRVFQPQAQTGEAGEFTALYYGTFIPNHGVPYIIEAARCLRGEAGLRFELIGEGPELARCQELARSYELEGVTFLPWMPQEELVQHAARAQVCLGAFGHTPQSLMTVQNKIYEGLALGRVVASGDSPAARQALTHGEHAWLCDREHPESLAEALRTLRADPALRERIAQAGLELFQAQFCVARLGERLRGHLEEACRPKKSR